MFQEFREFIARGNAFDLAVGIIMGTAFGNIVSSLVNDVLMPPIGLLLGGVDFSNLFISLSGQSYPSLASAKEAGAATINIGLFMNTVLNFLIVAFAIFVLVRMVNRLKRQPAPAPATPTTKACPHCLSTIPIGATRCAHCTAELRAA
jgi:large conductance mechanosensitive channel